MWAASLLCFVPRVPGKPFPVGAGVDERKGGDACVARGGDHQGSVALVPYSTWKSASTVLSRNAP